MPDETWVRADATAAETALALLPLVRGGDVGPQVLGRETHEERIMRLDLRAVMTLLRDLLWYRNLADPPDKR